MYKRIICQYWAYFKIEGVNPVFKNRLANLVLAEPELTQEEINEEEISSMCDGINC